MPDTDAFSPGSNATGSPAAPEGPCHLIGDIATGGRLASADLQPPTVADREAAPGREIVLELRVRNHPGTMSHITGLFARRAFNLDAILCVPVDDGTVSRILLLVGNEPRLEQVERQLAKLHDVLAVRSRPELGAATFRWLGEI